jgi:murein DD-endopeptidase MepM/ murein hydrolase activator NlpD
MVIKRYLGFLGLAAILCWTSCSDRGPLALFKKLSPHDQYGQRLKDAGLDITSMGANWLRQADESLLKPLAIQLPYRETGYFPEDHIRVSALRFEAKRGQMLHVTLSTQPVGFKLYADLWQVNGKMEWVASVDSVKLDQEIKQTGTYILRLQPELLRGGEYTLNITTGPSLGFPVAASGKPNIGSFWGDGRDANGRLHEGIDIFATKHTPAIATNDGVVERVGENNLGGKVIFMRPDGRDYNLYYAHLDVQLVRDGQVVHAGDTLGLTGNTGNAKNTPSHLHFGIYTSGGAIDPLPFVNREIKSPKPISASLKPLNQLYRNKQLPVTVLAATDHSYKILRPDGSQAYINSSDATPLSALKKLNIKTTTPIYDQTDTTAARKLFIPPGKSAELLGTFDGFQMVKFEDTTGWIKIF